MKNFVLGIVKKPSSSLMIEYGLIAALIAVGFIGAVTALAWVGR
jgi:Flp pilus assembly pilin Flp